MSLPIDSSIPVITPWGGSLIPLSAIHLTVSYDPRLSAYEFKLYVDDKLCGDIILDYGVIDYDDLIFIIENVIDRYQSWFVCRSMCEKYYSDIPVVKSKGWIPSENDMEYLHANHPMSIHDIGLLVSGELEL